MLETIYTPTTDYYYDYGLGMTISYDSIKKTIYVRGGFCDDLEVQDCSYKLQEQAKKELLTTIPNNEQKCKLVGFVWKEIKEFPQIASYPKSHCESVYEQICKVDYDGLEPIKSFCWWDKQSLNKIGRNKLVMDLINKYKNLYKK
jgi:hypothetical protein